MVAVAAALAAVVVVAVEAERVVVAAVVVAVANGFAKHAGKQLVTPEVNANIALQIIGNAVVVVRRICGKPTNARILVVAETGTVGVEEAVTVEEADRVAVAPVVAAVAAALEAEPVAVAAGATAAAVVKRHGQNPTKQLMRPGGHAMRALTSTQDTQRNAICAIHPTPERCRGDVKREAAGVVVGKAKWQSRPCSCVLRMACMSEIRHGVQQERHGVQYYATSEIRR